VADLPSSDLVPDQEIEGPQDRFPLNGLTFINCEHSAAHADQTAADADQTAADADQTAADNDQAASDLDLAEGGDPQVHAASRRLRHRTAERRDQTASYRNQVAADRDAIAERRDALANARDCVAALYDEEFAAEARLEVSGLATKISVRNEQFRKRAVASVPLATQALARAGADRGHAAADRKRAGRDRAQARADREALTQQLLIAETDALTGVRARGAGLADLEEEIDRAGRVHGHLVAAYIDVVGLKTVNDQHGHASGDALLQRAVTAIKQQLRSYDLVIRVGGDEFVCVLSGVTVQDVRRRFTAVSAALAASPVPCEIKVGFADLRSNERAPAFIARADADLPMSPGRRSPPTHRAA
jgi:diguanylate cyclase (GGDEF)-like protein